MIVWHTADPDPASSVPVPVPFEKKTFHLNNFFKESVSWDFEDLDLFINFLY